MAGTGEEAIVEGREEIGGRKRVSDDNDVRTAKRAKVEGNLGTVCLGAELLAILTMTGDKVGGGGGEEEPKEKVDRLRGLLEDNPKKLEDKDVEDVIHYLDVDEIISLALKSDEGKESEQYGVAEVEYWTEEECDCEKEADIVRSMMCYTYIGYVKTADVRRIYEKLSPKAFTTLLLAILDSNSIRRFGGGVPVVKAEDRDMIPKLYCVLPWQLLAHVLDKKGWVPMFYEGRDEVEEECTPVQKEAAGKCDICFGEGRHTGDFGEHCTFKDAVPYGASVGSNYSIVCSNCGFTEVTDTFEGCYDCGFGVGQAVPSDSLSDSTDSSS